MVGNKLCLAYFTRNQRWQITLSIINIWWVRTLTLWRLHSASMTLLIKMMSQHSWAIRQPLTIRTLCITRFSTIKLSRWLGLAIRTRGKFTKNKPKMKLRSWTNQLTQFPPSQMMACSTSSMTKWLRKCSASANITILRRLMQGSRANKHKKLRVSAVNKIIQVQVISRLMMTLPCMAQTTMNWATQTTTVISKAI